MKESIKEQALKSKTVLKLLGMKKEWIRINNKWVDLATVNVDYDIHDEEMEDYRTAPWWKFWAR